MKLDWNRYYEIERKPKSERTEEEQDFYRWMYQLEEIQSGLDGEQ